MKTLHVNTTCQSILNILSPLEVIYIEVELERHDIFLTVLRLDSGQASLAEPARLLPELGLLSECPGAPDSSCQSAGGIILDESYLLFSFF